MAGQVVFPKKLCQYGFYAPLRITLKLPQAKSILSIAGCTSFQLVFDSLIILVCSNVYLSIAGWGSQSCADSSVLGQSLSRGAHMSFVAPGKPRDRMFESFTRYHHFS